MANPDKTPGGGALEGSITERPSEQGRTNLFAHIAELAKRVVGGDLDAQRELQAYREELDALVDGLCPTAGREGLQPSPTAAPASGQPASQG